MKNVVFECRERRQSWAGRSRARLSTCAVLLSVLAIGVGCAAVYPEVATPIRDVPEGAKLDPPPPDDLLYLHVVSADIPKRTRDGRTWDEGSGNAPDPFVILFVDDQELFRTEAIKNTLHPIWTKKPRVNYRIPPRSTVRVELWDRNTMQHSPICLAHFRDIHDDVFSGGRRISCSSGAQIRLDVERAKPKMGIGMRFEVRTHEVFITRVYSESPASRAELRPGHQILQIQGKPVAEMVEGEAKSLVNANARTGVTISVLQGDSTMSVTLKDGPIYPVEGEGITLD